MLRTAAPTLCLWLSSSVLVITAATISGCVAAPPPYEEYTLARAAVRAAQDADAPRFSVGFWTKADDNYRNGQKAYRDADFDEAREFFKTAQIYAERAENSTRLKKFQTGESFP